MGAMIKNIIFDIGNVLVGFEPQEYIKSFHFSPGKEKAITKALFGTYAWNEYDRGALSMEEIEKLFAANAPEYQEAVVQVFRGAFQCITRQDYAIPWLQKLKAKGFRLYYLSNYSDHMRQNTLKALDFLPYMDGGLFSYEVHQIKPEPGIFRSLLDRYSQLRPEESVFFDDSPANIEAAANLDFNAILFRNKAQAETALEHLLTAMERV